MSQKTKRQAKYPWADWTDGAQWLVYRGEDYHLSTYNFQISLHGRAKASKLKVSTRSFIERTPDEFGAVQRREGLMFQFYSDD